MTLSSVLTMFLDSGIVKATADWELIIEEASSVYNNRSVSSILNLCFQKKFAENLDSHAWNGNNRLELIAAGNVLHTYINKFFDTYYNDPGKIIIADNFVRNMLANLKEKPIEPIAYDDIYRLDSDLETIHMDLHVELSQFYKFVNELEHRMLAHLHPETGHAEYSLIDRRHNVTGRCNALFRMEEYSYDKEHLMLYDWTRSLLMFPGKLSLQRKTLQMNIYKHILEKYEGKKIMGMKMVILHKDIKDYEIITIKDINFNI